MENWYDWFVPTTLIGAIFFGTLMSVIFALSNYRDTKDKSKSSITLISGVVTTVLVAFLLYRIGYID